MASLERPQSLPDAGRMSVLAATMLLAYALARLINLPLTSVSTQLPGLFLSLQFNLSTFVGLLVAGLSAAGTAWLIWDHPAIAGASPWQTGGARRTLVEHLIIPTLTAWVIGVPLFQLPLGPVWWAGFVLGGIILLLVLLAEYIVVDAADVRQPLASAGLTVVSFALYLILAASLRYAGLRLYLILPTLTLAAGVISLRTLHLRLHGRWSLLHAGIVALLVGQLVAALHYWPAAPISYGLALLGAAYSLTNLMGSLLEGTPLRQAAVEPGIILVVFWLSAYLMR